ncbi:MAG TPA: D-glycerate dehydrogenase [Usitatibacter sp.]|jgi:lactate dehydrogenase-like 2-hydroxyacid dehydrogenase|nr:D-glycerate dehydrogenase [Usitatibacter sp.]
MIVIVRAVFPEVVEALCARYDVVHNAEDRPWVGEELARRLEGASAAMTTVMDRFDAALLERCPKLQVISNIAVGYNNIDVAACTARGVRVTNTPGVLDDTTADLTWALLMAAARRIAEADAYVRAGDWKIAFGVQSFLGQDIHHATLGIIGMGRIGQAVARRAAGFDMRILYNNRSRLPEDEERRLGATRVERDELLREADFVVVMAPYSPATHHLVGARELALMKPTAVLVNSARGGVVDDAALVDALREKRIAAAGLDVFEGEPGLNPGYLQLRNVVMTPHIGSASRATRRVMCDTAAANLTAVLEGRTPPNPVN